MQSYEVLNSNIGSDIILACAFIMDENHSDEVISVKCVTRYRPKYNVKMDKTLFTFSVYFCLKLSLTWPRLR